MVYTKQTWVNSGASGGLGATSEVNAERMAHIEDGVEAAQNTADGLLGVEAGGVEFDVYQKQSSTDGDAVWTDPSGLPISTAAASSIATKAPLATSDLPVMFATAGGWPQTRAAFCTAVSNPAWAGAVVFDRVLYPSTADPTDQEYGDRLRDRV